MFMVWLVQGLKISLDRIEMLGFSGAASVLSPTLTTKTTPLQPSSLRSLLRVWPAKESNSFSSSVAHRQQRLTPELSSYQAAVELQRHLGEQPTSKGQLSRLHDPSVVGQAFAQLSHKMFVGMLVVFFWSISLQYYVVSKGNSFLPFFSLVLQNNTDFYLQLSSLHSVYIPCGKNIKNICPNLYATIYLVSITQQVPFLPCSLLYSCFSQMNICPSFLLPSLPLFLWFLLIVAVNATVWDIIIVRIIWSSDSNNKILSSTFYPISEKPIRVSEIQVLQSERRHFQRRHWMAVPAVFNCITCNLTVSVCQAIYNLCMVVIFIVWLTLVISRLCTSSKKTDFSWAPHVTWRKRLVRVLETRLKFP